MTEQRVWHHVMWRNARIHVDDFILRECGIESGAVISDEQLFRIQAWAECGVTVTKFLLEIRAALWSFKSVEELENYPRWLEWHIALRRGASEWDTWKRMMGSAD